MQVTIETKGFEKRILVEVSPYKIYSTWCTGHITCFLEGCFRNKALREIERLQQGRLKRYNLHEVSENVYVLNSILL